MAEQMRPASPAVAPDPSNNYERSHPENEAGMGRLDTNKQATPADAPDKDLDAAQNLSTPRQINAHETQDRVDEDPKPALPPQPDHSMKDEEPTGWDQAPQNISDPKAKRHPRTEGKGGTP